MSEKMQARISALLRNAEKAGTPEEAATFHAKAQELSALYSIDLELAGSGGRAEEGQAGAGVLPGRAGPDSAGWGRTWVCWSRSLA